MAIYFPQLNSAGLMTQRPFNTRQEFNTIKVEVPAGRPYTFQQRGSGLTHFPTRPLSRWQLSYSSLTAAELEVASIFFDNMDGRLREFIFLDPAGNLINYSEDYTNTYWTGNSTGVTVTTATGLTDPFGGSRASLLTGTTSNSNMAPYILPLGDASGFVFTASIWVKCALPGKQLSIGFIDSGFGVLGNKIFDLPQNQWKRLDYTITLATNSNIRVLYGGFGTWNSYALTVFGPSCVPMPGPGAYSKSPDNYGYHPKCRLDTDTFEARFVGPDEISLTLPVVEYNG